MKKLAATLTLSASLLITACAEAGPATELSETEIEQIVYSYLMENPEVVRDALIALTKKEDMASINAVRSEIYEDSRDAVIGPDDAKVTIVEFFDYNCSYCKRSTSWVQSVLDQYPDDVRIIFKETPILDSRTQTSWNASKAALAAARQDKYLDMHVALMAETSLTEARVRKLAEKNGLDMAKFDADMEDLSIDEHIEDTLILGRRIEPFTGTPFFLIGDSYYAGGNNAKLEEMLDEALEG